MVKIGENKGAAILNEVQPDGAGDLRKSAIAIVGEHDVSGIAMPRGVGADQFVDGVPSMLVSERRGSVLRGFGHHLAPEEAGEVVAVEGGDVAVGDIEVRVSVVIEIPEIRGPGPTAHFNAGLAADVFERSVALVPIEGIAARVALVEFADILRGVLVKLLLFRDPLSGGLPHAGNVNILESVVIEIGPTAAHSGPHVLDVGLA